LTIALSREAGARGYSIGQRVGQKLGWPVYNQELLEYISHEGPFRQNVAENLTGDSIRWADTQLEKLLQEQKISRHPSILDLARIVLALGSKGEVVLIGRGAGCILPTESTLHGRIIALLEDRIAYFSQWLRLTLEEATEKVRLRDKQRADFLSTHFHRDPKEMHQYDLLLNSSLLGEEVCAELIVKAAQAKMTGSTLPAGE
jgi:cytidylate kinase